MKAGGLAIALNKILAMSEDPNVDPNTVLLTSSNKKLRAFKN